jgi:hypothetical protein
MRPCYYANKIDIAFGPSEVVLVCKLKGTTGRPSEVCQLILPPDVAAKLGAILAPQKDSNDDQPDA